MSFYEIHVVLYSTRPQLDFLLVLFYLASLLFLHLLDLLMPSSHTMESDVLCFSLLYWINKRSKIAGYKNKNEENLI